MSGDLFPLEISKFDRQFALEPRQTVRTLSLSISFYLDPWCHLCGETQSVITKSQRQPQSSSIADMAAKSFCAIQACTSMLSGRQVRDGTLMAKRSSTTSKVAVTSKQPRRASFLITELANTRVFSHISALLKKKAVYSSGKSRGFIGTISGPVADRMVNSFNVFLRVTSARGSSEEKCSDAAYEIIEPVLIERCCFSYRLNSMSWNQKWEFKNSP